MPIRPNAYCTMSFNDFHYDAETKTASLTFFDYDLDDPEVQYAHTTVSFGYTEAGESNAGLVLGIIGTSLAAIALFGLISLFAASYNRLDASGSKMTKYAPVQMRTHFAVD